LVAAPVLESSLDFSGRASAGAWKKVEHSYVRGRGINREVINVQKVSESY